ncbi:CU044_5270 family protein [Dactylosporangium siamense]|uniref:CU044_5270 family protein n=1 Tax=Dactylosporangium siamense TaxID=685454 RepID=A0A919UCJ0_9ACTN|nr:CU044_5270 family protein [Dactylosporangium siamense]GIG45688.1 hypothetical protein Dsi01nite_037290 [Dactylosporangium siamense]
MNELDELRSFRAGQTPADPIAMARARAALAAPPRRHRRGWLLAPVAAAAALALAVGLMPGRPDHPTAVPPTAAPDPSASPVTRSELVLRNAAAYVGGTPALSVRPDQFVFVESIHVNSEGPADDGGPLVTFLRRSWLSADGTRDGLVTDRRKSGGPEERVVITCPPGHPCQPVYRADLPTDTDGMLRWFKDLITQRYGSDRSTKSTPDSYAWSIAGDLLREGYLPPASAAAVFTALARVNGLTVVESVTDAAGRTGVSVGIDGKGTRSEIIFDRATYAYLGERVSGPGGRIISDTAQLRLAIVDRPGQPG